MIGDTDKPRISVQHEVEYCVKVIQGEAVCVVEMMQLLQQGKYGTARGGDLAVLLSDSFHFSHNAFGLGHLMGDNGGFLLQRLKRLNDIVVVEDVAAGLV